jgi:enamine deaminase RidA (YjgF/YER057c/UK114 family)
MTLFPDAPYDYAAMTDDLVFTAGACPLDTSGNVVEPNDLEAQTERAVDNLLTALQAAGSGAEHIVKTTIFVAATGRTDLVRAWNVASPRLGRAPSTLLGVSVLGYEHQLVEIEAIAIRPDQGPGPR